MRKLFLYFLLLPFANLQAQDLSLGIGFGPYVGNRTGVNTVSDSITIIAEGSRSMLNVYSIFLEYQISKNINYRSALNGTDHLVGFLMYNSQATCQFCDLKKATTIGSFNLNLANSIAIKIPVKTPIEFHLLGGIRTNFNFTKNQPEIAFRNGERHQGLAEAINNVDDTIKPVYFNSIIGINSSWKKFSLLLELDKNLGRSITTDLTMYGKKYPFRNGSNTFTLTANYKIFPWKKINKSTE